MTGAASDLQKSDQQSTVVLLWMFFEGPGLIRSNLQRISRSNKNWN